MSLKNKWRSRGSLQFKRETRRYSDGTPSGGDVLYVRIKGKACVFAQSNSAEDSVIQRPGRIWANDGLYFCKPPVVVAKQLYEALKYKASQAS